MIDLIEYYKKNVEKEDYYYRFYKKLVTIPEEEHMMFEYDWIGNEYEDDTRFEVFDEEDAIKRFKELCEPNTDISSNKDNINLFYYLCYFLKNNGYILEEFPRLLERPPLEPYNFVYNEIRNRAIEKGLADEKGKVTYNARRMIIADFHFKRDTNIKVEDSINKKFQKISTRSATFESMTTDEKIKEILNLIENLLKKDGDYLNLEYEKIALDTLNDNTIIEFKKKIQCFRHSSEEAIKERKNFTEKQKKFIIDYGIMLCNLIYNNSN